MYNSDGYILIDLSTADMSKSNQYMPGLYHRVTVDCLGVNKLALVINAGDLTPMSAVINRSLNYYVITTSLYIFKINSNDILIIEQAGSSSVEVAIVPALLEGTKIADFQVGDTIGSLYAPTQQSEINDNVPSDHTTYSSDKINTLLSDKANSSDLATVATTGSYTDLTNKPTIPTKVSELQNDSNYVASSSLATVATTGSYTDLTNKPNIPTKVSELQNDSGYITDSALSDYQTKTDNTLDTTAKTITGAINEFHAINGYNYDAYDDTATYAVGDLCIYNNALYKCTTAITTAEAWNANHWTATSIAGEINTLQSNITASTMYGLTASTGVTNLNGGSIKISNARMINHNLKLNTAKNPNDKIIQLANTTDYPSSNSYLVLISSDGVTYRLTISTTGGIFATSATPTGEYLMQGFYIT